MGAAQLFTCDFKLSCGSPYGLGPSPRAWIDDHIPAGSTDIRIRPSTAAEIAAEAKPLPLERHCRLECNL